MPEREVGVVFALLRVKVIAEDIPRDASAKRAVFRRELPESALVTREKQLDYFLVVQNLTSFASVSSYKTDFFEEGFIIFEKFTIFLVNFRLWRKFSYFIIKFGTLVLSTVQTPVSSSTGVRRSPHLLANTPAWGRLIDNIAQHF